MDCCFAVISDPVHPQHGDVVSAQSQELARSKHPSSRWSPRFLVRANISAMVSAFVPRAVWSAAGRPRLLSGPHFLEIDYLEIRITLCSMTIGKHEVYSHWLNGIKKTLLSLEYLCVVLIGKVDCQDRSLCLRDM